MVLSFVINSIRLRTVVRGISTDVPLSVKYKYKTRFTRCVSFSLNQVPDDASRSCYYLMYLNSSYRSSVILGIVEYFRRDRGIYDHLYDQIQICVTRISSKR